MPKPAYSSSSSSEDEITASSSLAYSASKRDSTKATEQPKARQLKRKGEQGRDISRLRSSPRQIDERKDAEDEDIAPAVGE
jgi:hypothetical protein